MIFIFPGYHIRPPSFLARARFYGFFFPRDSEPEKKNRKPKLSSSPKKGKKRNWFEKNCDFFVTVFFPAKSRGKKKPLNFVLPSYFFGRPTVLYVITWKKKPYPFGWTVVKEVFQFPSNSNMLTIKL